MPANYTELEKSLWEAADQLRANSTLKPSEYSVPVLGLIFLRYADYKFSLVEKELAKHTSRRRRKIGVADYQAKCALFLPEAAQFNTLLNLPESENIGQKLVEAMKAIPYGTLRDRHKQQRIIRWQYTIFNYSDKISN